MGEVPPSEAQLAREKARPLQVNAAEPLPWGMVWLWTLLAIPLFLGGPAVAVFIGATNLPRPRAMGLVIAGVLLGLGHILLFLFWPQVFHWLYEVGILKSDVLEVLRAR